MRGTGWVKGERRGRCCTGQRLSLMKTRLLLFALMPVLAGVAAAQKAPTPTDRPTVVFKRQAEPVFPRNLLELGVTEGEARVVISIDTTGEVVDHLVVGYTHPDLAQAAVAAIKRWQFEPPVWHGQPVSVQREMRFNFEGRGVVVTMDVSSYVAMRTMSMFAENYVYRPVTMQEIDRIPTPLSTPAPLYPLSLYEANRGAVATVEFYIDESGNVRMPSVVESEDMDAATSAIATVRDWKFEPPTRNGKPVMVKVQQTFRFNPTAEKTADVSAPQG